MARPRRSLGNQPGRLPATMLRALAAELSDPGRYSRAKAYARDSAVAEIDIRPGEVSGEVYGSRRVPYTVSLHVDPLPADELDAAAGSKVPTLLIPEPSELEIECTCPDADDGWLGGNVCKHALAVLLVLADEVSIEPELLARWREGGDEQVRTRAGVRPRRRDVVVPSRPRSPATAPRRTRVDVLAPLLRSPQPIGELPDLTALTRPRLATPPAAADGTSQLLDRLLAEAIEVITDSR